MDSALEEEEEDVIEWDWLGEDSPLMASASEAEFILEKLCESLVRYTKRIEKRVNYGIRELKRRKVEKDGSADHTQGGMEVLRMVDDVMRGRTMQDNNESLEEKKGAG